MREIKFRAWDEDLREMFVVDVLDWHNAYFIRRNNGDWYSKSTTVLMQFTGLLDRNGQDIYEGDILIDDDTDEVDYAKVEWFEGGWSAHPWFGAQEFFNEAEGYEVVGNIYENPDLLKGGV